jgi:pimeloyl-ACP methyl ester carboxylesterase
MTPQQTRVVTSAGTFACLRAGEPGRPVVLLLHGFPDTAYGWRGILPHLAATGFDAVAPWMRGYDPSVKAGPYHLDRLGDDVIALADALSPGRPVHVVGHDWGAMATYQALARSPGRFGRAVTMAVPHPQALLANIREFPGQLRLSWYMGFFQLGRLADERVAAYDFELVMRLWASWSPGFKPDDEYLAELRRCLGASMPAPLEYYRALFRPLRELLRRARTAVDVRTPLLNLHGEDDQCIDPRMTQGQERYVRAPFEPRLVRGAGHFLQLERPDEVGAMIVDWLKTGR